MTRDARFVAVFDLGKTNAKVILFDRRDGTEVLSLSQANRSAPPPPYLHFNVAALETFLVDGLRQMAELTPLDAIVVATHGASAAVVDDAGLALPPLDYDDQGPDEVREDYDRLRPDFADSGSPRFPGGLNVGAQLHWLKARFAEPFAAATAILMWPQYWSWRLSGTMASEVTSLASHTDLWDVASGGYSVLVDRLGIGSMFPPMRRAYDVLGPLRPDIAQRVGVDGNDVAVLCGIHDSNADLIPFLTGGEGPRTVVSTGTWIAVFAIGTGVPERLPREDGVMVSVDVFGRPMPNFRFPGGRIYRHLTSPGVGDAPELTERLRAAGMSARLDDDGLAVTGPDGAERPPSDFDASERGALAAMALAEHTARGIGWIGGAGETIVTGPFTRNAAFLHELGRRVGEVRAELHHGGVSRGAVELTALG